MNNWLSELQALRQSFIDIVRGNKFESGVRQSAVEKYADPVHFIFELIQNAEDQEAKNARFTVTDNAIIFEHDGKPFSQGDVERITGWGQSDKPNQANKIGRFGIGFKSVFVVTDSPEVYLKKEGSNEVPSFRIRDLFVPEIILEDPEYAIPNESDCSTRFVLRFRSVDAKRLSELIQGKFESFSADVLLFLQYLKRIEWSAGDRSGICERFDRDGIRRISTSSKSPSNVEEQKLKRYLLFNRSIELHEVERQQSVKLAFLIDDDGKIIAEEPEPPLHVFFPTEERPGLKFRLHAPFLLTDNRANIKQGVEENKLLVEECAKLLRDALKEIKERGKLTVSLLNILPFNRIHFPPSSILASLFDAAFDIIYRDRSLPCADGTFCTWSDGRFIRDTRLIEIVPDKLLTELLDAGRKIRWLHKDFGRSDNQQVLSFLGGGIARELGRRGDNDYASALSLNIELEWTEVVSKFSKVFLEARRDSWIEELYSFLDKQESAAWRPTYGELRDCPIVRLTSGLHVAPSRHDRKPNAFLPSDVVGDYPTVKSQVIRDDAALSFIKRLGIGAPDLAARILEVILPKYDPQTATKISLEQHLQDFEIVCSFVEKGSGVNFELVWKSLDQTRFFLARNVVTDERRFCRRNDIYLESPDLMTFLSGNEGAWVIDSAYAKWTDILRSRFKIADGLKVSFRVVNSAGYVPVAQGHGHHERGLNRFDPYAEVEGLEHALKVPTLEKARIIWNRILVVYPFLIKGETEQSRRVNFNDARRLQKQSRLGKVLVNTAWLPAPEGGWSLPKDLSMEDLPPEFVRNHEVSSQLNMRQSLITELAAQKRITVGLLQRMLEAAERDPGVLEKLLRDLKSSDTESTSEQRDNSSPIGPVNLRPPLEKLAAAFVARGATALEEFTPAATLKNPDRYRRELENQIKERKAAERPREQRQGVKLRRVWEDANPAVRNFLAETYQGQCQISGKTFAKRDGKPYFEVWYLISTQEAEWLDEPGNALCVCPEFWAKLEYGARDADSAAVVDQILHWKARAEGGTEDPILKIKLCGGDVVITYDERHMLRLQSLVRGLVVSSEIAIGQETGAIAS